MSSSYLTVPFVCLATIIGAASCARPEEPARPRCEGTCLADCRGDGDCLDPAAARCDLESGQCAPCLDDAACPDGLARCLAGVCVACITDTDCEDHAAGPVCHPTAHTCALCTSNEHCAGETPTCDVQTQTCVGCVSHDDCAGSALGPRCEPSRQVCVACLDDGDCQSPQGPRCELQAGELQNQCMPCRLDANDCAPLDGLPVCAAGPQAAVCVECTSDAFDACRLTESHPPGSAVCNSLTQSCTAVATHSAELCEPCVADVHCAAGLACVHEEYGGISLGFVCIPEDPGSCDALLPFSEPTSDTTLDGHTVDTCRLRVTTCAALADSGSQSCASHVNCGNPGVDDGRCASSSTCTTPCAVPSDCGSGTCDAGLCGL